MTKLRFELSSYIINVKSLDLKSIGIQTYHNGAEPWLNDRLTRMMQIACDVRGFYSSYRLIPEFC